MSDEREDTNDIAAVLDHPGNLVMKLVMGRQTVEETQSLIDHVGKVEINIGDGLTLLHQAASNNRPDLVDFLCNKGHNTEVRSIAGETPLDQAAWKNALDAVMFLLKHGADVDSQTNCGYTPLHRAAFYDHPRLVGILAMAGADQKLRDHNGQTAYEVAVSRGNEAIANTLKPLIDSEGNDLTGIMYATNNPKHPNFRPQARESLFSLYVINRRMEMEGNDEEEDENEEEDEKEEGGAEGAGEEEERSEEGEAEGEGCEEAE